MRIGDNHRAQLIVGDDGAVIVRDERRPPRPGEETHSVLVRVERRPPRPGEETHSVLVRVEDAKAHCEHARSRGARIVMEPTDFEYGERQYAVEDFAGHHWTCSETLDDVDPEAWGGETITPG